jgi:hypothetical protein
MWFGPRLLLLVEAMIDTDWLACKRDDAGPIRTFGSTCHRMALPAKPACSGQRRATARPRAIQGASSASVRTPS